MQRNHARALPPKHLQGEHALCPIERPGLEEDPALPGADLDPGRTGEGPLQPPQRLGAVLRRDVPTRYPPLHLESDSPVQVAVDGIERREGQPPLPLPHVGVTHSDVDPVEEQEMLGVVDLPPDSQERVPGSGVVKKEIRILGNQVQSENFALKTYLSPLDEQDGDGPEKKQGNSRGH